MVTEQIPHTTLTACGEAVGLPEGQMGNSEVGHLNIGAGRIVYQRQHALTLQFVKVSSIRTKRSKVQLKA